MSGELHSCGTHIALTYDVQMELKTARLTLLIDPAKKIALEELCATQDLTPSQVVRQLIRDYLAAHDVSFIPSGKAREPAAAPARAKSTPRPGQTRQRRLRR